MSGSARNYQARKKSFGFRGNSGGQALQSYNLTVQLVDISLANPGESTPYTAELGKSRQENAKAPYDVARVRLLADFPAGEMKKGDIVEVAMPLPKAYLPLEGRPGKEYKGRNIARWGTPMGSGEALRADAIIHLEGAWARDGRLFAQFASGGPNRPVQENGSIVVLPDVMVSVSRRFKRANSDQVGQTVMMVEADKAVTIPKTKDPDGNINPGQEIFEAYKSFFPNHEDTSKGTPGVVFLARRIPPADLEGAALEDFYANFENREEFRHSVYSKHDEATDTWKAPTAEEAMTDFFGSDKEEVQDFIANRIGSEEWDIQMAPYQVVGQSKNRLDAPVDISENYRGYERDEESGRLEAFDSIFVPSSMSVMRVIDWRDENGNPVKATAKGTILDADGEPTETKAKLSDARYGVPKSIHQAPHSRFGSVGYYLADLPTAGMPEGHLKAVLAEGERVKKNTADFYKEAKAFAQSKEAEPDNDTQSPRPAA